MSHQRTAEKKTAKLKCWKITRLYPSSLADDFFFLTDFDFLAGGGLELDESESDDLSSELKKHDTNRNKYT